MEVAYEAKMLRRFAQRRPQVMLEWDSVQSKVVAAPSQIGLSWAQVSFTDSAKAPPGLVDSFAIPEELLQLPNLNDILSMETWDTCLTDSERELLSMCLPEGVDLGSTVEALLSGENFYFGNPLEKWGESVCAGEMHPDTLLRRELDLKQQRNAYSKHLRNYHGKMVKNLQKMKKVWEYCENPDDFLPQIQRYMTAGQKTRGHLKKNVFYPTIKASENADLRKRSWDASREAMEDREKGMSARPKPKKQKISKLPEDGSQRLKIKPPEGETMRLEITPLEEGRKQLHIKSTGELKDTSARPKTKGGKVGPFEEGTRTLAIKTSDEGSKRWMINLSEEGTKRQKVKPSEDGAKRLKIRSSEEGPNRLEVNTFEEGSKRLQIKHLEEGKGRLKIKPSHAGSKREQIKPLQEGVKQREIKLSEEATKRPKISPFNEGTKRLKIRPSVDAMKRMDVRPSVEGLNGVQIGPPVEEIDLPTRPKANRSKGKSSERGMKNVEKRQSEPVTKALPIKVADAGRITLPLDEERDPLRRPKAKRPNVKSIEEGTTRLKIKPSEGPRRLMIKPLHEVTKVQKIEPAQDRSKTLKMKSSGEGGKRPKDKPSEEGAQRLKVKHVEEGKGLPSRPREKRHQARSPQQGAKGLKIKPSDRGQVEFDVTNSDFEGEWFKKYVQVTIAPLSGQNLSKAIHSVKVTTKMFEDVKRRSEAGEEVHLDTLDPIEGRSSDTQALKKNGGLRGNELELIASFWKTVLLKDLPSIHADFMERKEQQRKLAASLASDCKDIWEIEVINPDHDRDYASPSRDGASPNETNGLPSEGEASLSGVEASPSGGEASLSVGDASPSGVLDSPIGGEGWQGEGEASPSGREGSPSGGGEGFVSGDEPWPSGDEALPNRDEAFQSGDEALPSGDEALPSGDDPVSSGDGAAQSGGEDYPSEADMEEQSSIKSRSPTPH